MLTIKELNVSSFLLKINYTIILINCHLKILSTAKSRDKTPFKATWLVPILTPDITLTPNLSNSRCKIILAPFMKVKYMTLNLLQNARTLTKVAVFGDPLHNVQYATALCEEIKKEGHDIVILTKDARSVLKELKRLTIADEVLKQKTKGVLMTAKSKKEFITSWSKKNASMLDAGGLGAISVGDPTPHFCSGFFFSPKFTKEAMQYLQQTFQADACHVGFGKYSMYTIYGTSANSNTFLIAFGIQFGNETKEGWTAFLEFVKKCHPTANTPLRTFITDQAKGLIDSIAEVFNKAGQLLCYFHRVQNILKVVRGGSGPNSCVGHYRKCIQATNMDQLLKFRTEAAQTLSDKALKYLFSIPDPIQFPCARVGDNPLVILYNRISSSSAEGMNNVNKPARDRSAVDPVNCTLLLCDMAIGQYKRNCDKAWNCKSLLTPNGEKLRDDIFAKVDYTNYVISVSTEKTVNVRISRIGNIERVCYFLKEEIMGSVFGGCSCGAPSVKGIPCHHMIAATKCGRIEGLNPTNAMPLWWTTIMWRKQYPRNLNHTTVTMNTLTSNHIADNSLRYCPPNAAARKAGRPKGTSKRCKSPMEGSKKKVKVSTATKKNNLEG